MRTMNIIASCWNMSITNFNLSTPEEDAEVFWKTKMGFV